MNNTLLLVLFCTLFGHFNGLVASAFVNLEDSKEISEKLSSERPIRWLTSSHCLNEVLKNESLESEQDHKNAVKQLRIFSAKHNLTTPTSSTGSNTPTSSVDTPTSRSTVTTPRPGSFTPISNN